MGERKIRFIQALQKIGKKRRRMETGGEVLGYNGESGVSPFDVFSEQKPWRNLLFYIFEHWEVWTIKSNGNLHESCQKF